jgi:hypothetical protein
MFKKPDMICIFTQVPEENMFYLTTTKHCMPGGPTCGIACGSMC